MKLFFVRKAGILVAAALMLSFAFLSSTAFAVPGDDKIYKSITSEEMFELMKAAGYDVSYDDDDEPADDTLIVWLIKGTRATMFFYDDNKALQMYCVHTKANVDLDDVNEWNMSKRFSRAYLDEDDDPCLELDLDLAGGVTKARILDYLETCVVSVSTWRSTVIKR